jgi:hypothetical protein
MDGWMDLKAFIYSWYGREAAAPMSMYVLINCLV